MDMLDMLRMMCDGCGSCKYFDTEEATGQTYCRVTGVFVDEDSDTCWHYE